MTRPSKTFDLTTLQAAAVQRLQAGLPLSPLQRQDLGVLRAKLAAVPPPAMAAAPMAPARGAMQLVDNYIVHPGGTRSRDGAHWRGVGALQAMNVHAHARHAARHGDAPFAPMFTAAQMDAATTYRAIVEWRDGSPLKCASLESGRSGGGGSGLFIDTYIDQGTRLDAIYDAIGLGLAMDVRRHMDRDNARRPITTRALVDRVVLLDQDLTAVLRAYSWAKKTTSLAEIRTALCAALDRMAFV